LTGICDPLALASRSRLAWSIIACDFYWQFIDVRAVQLDPVDLRGLPRISGTQTEWVPPKSLPTSGNGILFLDELTSEEIYCRAQARLLQWGLGR